MEAIFDPYYKWLGIPPHEQPPNHYRLLGLGPFESNTDVIETAADRQMRHVQTFKAGQHSAVSQKVLNELSQARVCLLRPDTKAAYDRQLQAALDAKGAAPSAAKAQPLRRGVVLEEQNTEGPTILPAGFAGTIEVGPLQPISRPSQRRPPGVLAAGGVIAACLVAALAVLAWRLQPVPPELAPLADQVVDEGQLVELALSLKDPEAASQAIEYYLVEGAPLGTRVDRKTGKFTWMPSEEQGPGQYPLTVRAALAGSPQVFHEQPFRISVNEVGQPPQFDPVDARNLTQRGKVLSLQLRARDLDIPTSPLRYTVNVEPAASGSPEIDEKAGLFRWQPESADLGKSYQLTFKVSKASDESLSAEQTIRFALQAPPPATPPAPTVAANPPAPEPMPVVTPTPEPPAASVGPATPEPAVASKEKAEVPDADAQKKAAEKIEMIFGQQLAARKPDERRALAREFMAQAPGTTELTERYMLLVQARDLAVAGNDVPAAWQAIDALDQDFEIEALSQKIEALKKGSTGARTASDSHDHAQRSVALIEQALREEKFELAQPLVQPATASAAKAKDLPLVNRIKELGKDLKDQEKEFDAVQTARETLKAAPDDAAANFAVGRYQSLSRGQWSAGLPLLRKGGNEKWAAAATTDLANPEKPADQVAAGDAWWVLAEAAKAAEKEALQKRAAHWYRQAAPLLTGLDKVKLDKKLEKLPPDAAAVGVPRPIPAVVGSRTQPPPLAPPQLADLKNERRVAESFMKANQGYMYLRVEGQQQQVHIGKEADIPSANFVVHTLGFLRATTDDELLALKDLKFIENLSVLSGHQITAAGIAQMQALPSLQSVSLSNVPVTDAQLAEFRRLPRLESLYVRYGNCAGGGLAALSALQKLSRVEISSSMLTDEAIEAAARLPALQSLSISGSNIRGTGLAALRSSRALTSLTLNCSGIDEGQMAALAALPGLTSLHLEGSFGDATLTHISRIPKLRSLHWEGGEFTASGMKALSAARSFEQLTLNGDTVTDELIKSLPALGRLQHLNLINGKQVTDKGLEPLTKMAYLESVMVQQAASITNDGLAHLTKIPGVQTVYVSGASGITDAGLQHFRGRQQIRRLSFYSSQITDAGVQAFKQVLSNCQVSK